MQTKQEKKQHHDAGFNTFTHVLNAFDTHMNIRDWTSLLLESYGCFFNIFVRSPYCLTLFKRVCSYLIQSLQELPPEYSISITTADEMEHTFTSQELLELYENNLLFHKINHLFKDRHRWSFFANVLRWCDYSTMQWILQRCEPLDIMYDTMYITSNNGERVDNPLTLSLYNIDSQLFHYIIDLFESNKQHDILCEWLLANESISFITALVRLSFFHPQQAAQRFFQMNELCNTLYTHKNQMISTLVLEWNYHNNIHRDCSDVVNPFDTLTTNALLNQLFELPYQLEGKQLYGILAQCKNEDDFNEVIQNAFSTYQLVQPIDTYIALVQDRCIPIQYIQALEEHPKMFEIMKSIPSRPREQQAIILSWLDRDDMPEYYAFIHRAKHRWMWNLDKLFSSNLSTFNSYNSYGLNNILYRMEFYKWYALACDGLLPLCVYHPTHNDEFMSLHTMLKAFRLIRKCLRNTFQSLRHTTTNTRKRLHFIIKCQPEYYLKHKIQRTGVHFSNVFHC